MKLVRVCIVAIARGSAPNPVRSLRLARLAFAVAAFAGVGVGCDPPKPFAEKDAAVAPASSNAVTTNAASASASASSAPPMATGPIPLADATAGLKGDGTLYADLDIENGKLSCKLLEDKAPRAVANFVGLARGLQPFKDPATGQWVKRPAYDGTTLHRIIKGFLIQGGDPTGTGKGNPGYAFDDEVWGQKHDRAGLLCMENTGPNKNGMQWMITDDTAPHLDTSYTIFGECAPIAVVHKLASTPVGPDGETPVVKPKVLSIKIRREKAKKDDK